MTLVPAVVIKSPLACFTQLVRCCVSAAAAASYSGTERREIQAGIITAGGHIAVRGESSSSATSKNCIDKSAAFLVAPHTSNVNNQPITHNSMVPTSRPLYCNHRAAMGTNRKDSYNNVSRTMFASPPLLPSHRDIQPRKLLSHYRSKGCEASI